MENIILIETSTELCSTAIACDGKIISSRESGIPRAHASLTAMFIDEMLRETGLGIKDCCAVCVSMGPGSYTGLRVGVSTAKGLCFGAGIPLLAVGTLDTLVWKAIGGNYAVSHGNMEENPETGPAEKWKYIVPMIDARRMEVYTAVFSSDGRQLTGTEAKIIDSGSFSDLLSEGPVLFIGDAADKCSKVIADGNASFMQCCPDASSMLVPAMAEYKEKRFKDVAYFEPFYLKDFVATVSRKKLF